MTEYVLLVHLETAHDLSIQHVVWVSGAPTFRLLYSERYLMGTNSEKNFCGMLTKAGEIAQKMKLSLVIEPAFLDGLGVQQNRRSDHIPYWDAISKEPTR